MGLRAKPTGREGRALGRAQQQAAVVGLGPGAREIGEVSADGSVKPTRVGQLLGRLVGARPAPETSVEPADDAPGMSDDDRLAAALVESGLFQPQWYLAQNPDVSQSGVSPLDHYLVYGGAEGRAPNPVFRSDWYLAQNPDVQAAGMNPLVHYSLYGEKECRNPNPYFDVAWYRATYRMEIGHWGELAHYLKHRRLNRYAPNPAFDPAYYLAANADVAASGADPLEHFLGRGWQELRNPRADFDTRFYISRHLRHDPSDPVTHYLGVGREAGLPINETQLSPRSTVRSSFAQRRKVLLVGDLPAESPSHGRVLDLASVLREQFGVGVEFLVRADVPVLNAYRAIGPAHLAERSGDLYRLARTAAEEGIAGAILTTLEAGSMIAPLKDAGLRVVALVDEGGGEIEQHAHVGAVQTIAREADVAVFETSALYESFLGIAGWLRGAVRVSDPESPNDVWPAEDAAFQFLEAIDPDLKRVSVIVSRSAAGLQPRDRFAQVFGQTHPVFETLIADPSLPNEGRGSAAQTASAAKRRVKSLEGQRASSHALVQLSKAVASARGDLVWITDGADTIEADFIDRLSPYFDDPATLFAFSATRDTGVELARQEEGEGAFESARIFALRDLSRHHAIATLSAVLWRRDVLLAALGWMKAASLRYPDLAAWQLCLHACAAGGKVGHCADALVAHVPRAIGDSEAYIAEVERVQTMFTSLFGRDDEVKREQAAYRDEVRRRFSAGGPGEGEPHI